MYKPYLGAVLTLFSGIDYKQEKWKIKIKKEWKESQNFPRKKKKKVRKRLRLEWNIANVKIFEL